MVSLKSRPRSVANTTIHWYLMVEAAAAVAVEKVVCLVFVYPVDHLVFLASGKRRFEVWQTLI